MVQGITDYGKHIKARLVELNQPQGWLVEEVKKRTGLYFDTWYLHRAMTGQYVSPKITEAIDMIIDSTAAVQ